VEQAPRPRQPAAGLSAAGRAAINRKFLNRAEGCPMSRIVIVAVALAVLSGCAGRFAGFNNCSADGSLVVFEHPNAKGTYEGLNNGPCKR
jgi:hypothetical protein